MKQPTLLNSTSNQTTNNALRYNLYKYLTKNTPSYIISFLFLSPKIRFFFAHFPMFSTIDIVYWCTIQFLSTHYTPTYIHIINLLGWGLGWRGKGVADEIQISLLPSLSGRSQRTVQLNSANKDGHEVTIYHRWNKCRRLVYAAQCAWAEGPREKDKARKICVQQCANDRLVNLAKNWCMRTACLWYYRAEIEEKKQELRSMVG